MLYLISTPIGNLKDLTHRAVEILKTVDLILCEDTRHSLTLLRAYEITNSLESYHKFSEKRKLSHIIAKLKEGMEIAIISDAGTPLISDPGGDLVSECLNEEIQVTAIPGPSALIAALTVSGLDASQFQFIGFLPKKKTQALLDLAMYPGTTICYESPKRLLSTLEALNQLIPDRRAVVARELTKQHEEVIRGTSKEILDHFKTQDPRGEIVLLIAGDEHFIDWKSLPPTEHVTQLMNTYQLSKQDAVKIAAKLRSVPKGEIYKDSLDI
ncbi:MAG: 16S rRNA (cytidine(1402)-2'-O)-methyltransferase [Waddliaceae bacterium]